MGLPSDLVFRTKGQLATGICDGALAGGTRSRWHHQRARLTRDGEITQVS